MVILEKKTINITTGLHLEKKINCQPDENLIEYNLNEQIQKTEYFTLENQKKKRNTKKNIQLEIVDEA